MQAPGWACGDNMVLTHTADSSLAPVTKTVTYGTVSTALTGSARCWITQNLGADQQAGSATDNTEASAGWYWQFNRSQGYKHDGATRTLSTPWTTVNETSDWIQANDPCYLLLGTGWRLPTNNEWNNANSTGGWVDYDNDATGTFGSVLKLHAAGALSNLNGTLSNRGSIGNYWSSTQNFTTLAYHLVFSSSYSFMTYDNKSYGYSVRCLKD